MNLILAILIYLNILISGNTYYQSYINTEINALQTQIELIENDLDQMNTVEDVDLPLMPTIIIIDDNVG